MNETCRAFDRLVEEFFGVWRRYHPVQARAAGYLSNTPPPIDDDEIGALMAWLESTLVGLEELPFANLDGRRRIDLRMLFAACQLEYADLMERDWRHRDPAAYLEAVADCPKGAPDTGLIAEFLRHARGQIASFPEVVPRCAIHATRKLGERLARCLREADLTDEATVQARHAIQDYLAFIEEKIAAKARGSGAVGEEVWRGSLKVGYLVSATMDAKQAPHAQAEGRDGIDSPARGQDLNGMVAAWFDPKEGEEADLAGWLGKGTTLVRRLMPNPAMKRAWGLYLQRLHAQWQGADSVASAQYRDALSRALAAARLDREFHLVHIGPEQLQEGLQAASIEPGAPELALMRIVRYPGLYTAALDYYRRLEMIAVGDCRFQDREMTALHAALRKQGAISLPLLNLRE